MDAQYRKYNDHSQNSSTYHKKDGTNVRAILKREAREIIKETQVPSQSQRATLIQVQMVVARFIDNLMSVDCEDMVSADLITEEVNHAMAFNRRIVEIIDGKKSTGSDPE